jgi:hypothetical protein
MTFVETQQTEETDVAECKQPCILNASTGKVLRPMLAVFLLNTKQREAAHGSCLATVWLNQCSRIC